MDPKLPRSTRLSPKPLTSTPRDHPEGSQSQPRGASVQRCPQSGLKTVKQLFRGTPLHAKTSKVLRLPTKSSLAELAGHSYLCLPLPTFAMFPTHQVLLRAPFLHAPGARMTVVELTPSKYLAGFLDLGSIWEIWEFRGVRHTPTCSTMLLETWETTLGKH